MQSQKPAAKHLGMNQDRNRDLAAHGAPDSSRAGAACARACILRIYLRAFLHARRAEISAVAPAARHRCSQQRVVRLRWDIAKKSHVVRNSPKKVKMRPASDAACAGLGRRGFEDGGICGPLGPKRLPGRTPEPRLRSLGNPARCNAGRTPKFTRPNNRANHR